MNEVPVRPTTVAFVLCPAYHGATLLSLLLSQHPDVTAMGDTLPFRANPDFWCSCGQQIQHCDFWCSIRDTTHPENFPAEEKWIPELPSLSSNPQQNMNMTAEWLRSPRSKRRIVTIKTRQQATSFLQATHLLWNVAARHRATSVVIDGAKSIWRHLALTEYDGYRYPVIHLVRDPRAYVVSHRRNNADDSTIIQIASSWRSYHEDIEQLCIGMAKVPCLRIRYEDLCLATEETLGMIFDFLKVDRSSRPSEVPHHVIGNRMLAQFDGTIMLDQSYVDLISEEEQQAILRICEPFGDRYGYV